MSEFPPIADQVTADLFKQDVYRRADRIGVEVKEIYIRDMTRPFESIRDHQIGCHIDHFAECPGSMPMGPCAVAEG